MATPTTLRYQWQATSGTTALATTTATLLIAGQTQTDLTGGTRQLRNYLTDLSLVNLNATVSTLVSILDGSTVIWTGYADHNNASTVAVPFIVNFTTPIHSSPGNALYIQCNTTGATLYWSAQGFSATAN